MAKNLALAALVSTFVSATDSKASSWELKEDERGLGRVLATDLESIEDEIEMAVMQLEIEAEGDSDDDDYYLDLKSRKSKKKKSSSMGIIGACIFLCCCLPLYICARASGAIKDSDIKKAKKKKDHSGSDSDYDDGFKKVKGDKAKVSFQMPS